VTQHQNERCAEPFCGKFHAADLRGRDVSGNTDDEEIAHWRRLQDHVTMWSEAEGVPIGRALTLGKDQHFCVSVPQWRWLRWLHGVRADRPASQERRKAKLTHYLWSRIATTTSFLQLSETSLSRRSGGLAGRG
jgi:hypothetical protein